MVEFPIIAIERYDTHGDIDSMKTRKPNHLRKSRKLYQ